MEPERPKNTWEGIISKSDTGRAQDLIRLDTLPQKFSNTIVTGGPRVKRSLRASGHLKFYKSCLFLVVPASTNPTLTHQETGPIQESNLGGGAGSQEAEEPGHIPVLH